MPHELMAIDENKLSLCRKFYIELNGRQHGEIQRLMREAGYTTFTTRCLYRASGKPGYIERFKWRDELLAVGGGRLAGSRVRRSDRQQPSANSQQPSGFAAWLKHVSPNYTWNWRYQQYVYKHLERVTSGECKRLMIFMPPRHGKSELVTVRYAAWRLQQNPSLNIILGSYNQKLANRFSRKIRNVYAESQERFTAETQRHRGSPKQDTQDNQDTVDIGSGDPKHPVYPVKSDSRRLDVSAVQTDPGFRPKRANTAEEWETRMGGGVRAVGVGAGITGFGAKLVIIDDPVKSRAEAESPTYRNRVSDWFSDDIYTRLEPDAAVILIQTRWHEDDLAGRLLKDIEHGGEHWDVISLPALAEPAVTREESKQDIQDKQDTNVLPSCVSCSSR